MIIKIILNNKNIYYELSVLPEIERNDDEGLKKVISYYN